MNRGRLPSQDPAKNQGNSAVSKAVQAALDANLERKLCISGTANTVTSSGVMQCVTSTLVRGDASVNECTGILIKPKKLEIRCTWSNAASYNTVRMVVFRWHDASAPVGSGILYTTATAFAPLSPISWVNHRKIQVLLDKSWILYDHGATVCARTMSVVVNPGKAPIQLPLSGAGATPQMDGIYVLLISDDSLAPQPVCDLYTALQYTDA